jgi:hypothetical protein
MGTEINKETRRYWDNYMDARDWLLTMYIPHLLDENKPEPRVVWEQNEWSKDGRFWIGGFHGVEPQLEAGAPIVYLNMENPEKHAVSQIDIETEEEYQWQAAAVEKFREYRKIAEKRKNPIQIGV